MTKGLLRLFIIASMVATIGCEEMAPPKVTLKDGSEIIGIYEDFHNDDLPVHMTLESYYGIPYAEPPTGDLRFKPPVAKGKLDSPFSASKVGKSCFQMDPSVTGLRLINEEMSEDCLFLDVIVPEHKPEKAPVLVAIHGGGFYIGAGNMPYASVRPLVSYGNFIGVTMNYRLGAIGFMTTGDDRIPGNVGLLDQQLALKWVHDNIEAFGGDPDKVTIQGVSAGSASVGYHMISPGSRGLFRYGIMESGSPINVWITNRSGEEGRKEVKTLARLIDCKPEDIEDDDKLMECLNTAPADLLVEKITKVGQELGDPNMLAPGPNIDGTFLERAPLALIEEGKVNGEKVIVGTNAEEGTLFLSLLFPDKEVKPVVNASTFGTALGLLFSENIDPALHDLIKMVYAPDPSVLLDESRDDFFAEVTQFLGDGGFMCTESKYARIVSSFMDVYRYTMTYVPTNNFMGFKWAGAAHGDEGQYVAGAIFENEDMYSNPTKEEKDLARSAMTYWINFIKTGNPNSPGGSESASLPDWPKFTKESEIFKDLTPAMHNIHMKRTECYFMEHVLPPLRKAFEELQELRQRLKGENLEPTDDVQCEGVGCDQGEAAKGKDEL